MGNYLITGANSEIGKSLAVYLKQQGHNLLLVSRSKIDSSITENTSWIDGIDLTKEENLNTLADKVSETFHGPFIFVHSVGDFWEHKSITDSTLEEAKSMILSHYLTLYGTIRVLAPIMRKVGGGRIIAFSCNSVKYNYPDMAAFTSSKAAVECLIRCVANEQSQYKITANAFALPSIATEHVKRTKPEEYWNSYVTVDELVETVEKTIENLSPYVNGTTINLFKYSRSFYHASYYERNKIWEAKK